MADDGEGCPDKDRQDVMVAVPTDDGWNHTGVTVILLEMLADPRYGLKFIFPCRIPVENNRNHLVREFLRGDQDYLLMVDADNPPFKNPLDLVELDRDVIICPTLMWRMTPERLRDGTNPLMWNALDEQPDGQFKEHEVKEGIEEIDGAGTGCMLVARRVFETVKAPFLREWGEDGVATCGSDLAFCKRARAAGWKIWVHWDYPCHHYNEVDLCEVKCYTSTIAMKHADTATDREDARSAAPTTRGLD